MKLIRKKKSTGQRGKRMGTHGSGARKNKRKSGHKGGVGMAGTGKRGDAKKTLVLTLYGHKYFGKQGITSRKTKRDVRKRINVGEIQMYLEKYGVKKGTAWEVDLKKYKILGKGDVKDKLNVTCFEISVSAKEKIEAAGGKVIVKEKKEIVTPVIVNPKHAKKAEKKKA